MQLEKVKPHPEIYQTADEVFLGGPKGRLLYRRGAGPNGQDYVSSRIVWYAEGQAIGMKALDELTPDARIIMWTLALCGALDADSAIPTDEVFLHIIANFHPKIAHLGSGSDHTYNCVSAELETLHRHFENPWIRRCKNEQGYCHYLARTPDRVVHPEYSVIGPVKEEAAADVKTAVDNYDDKLVRLIEHEERSASELATKHKHIEEQLHTHRTRIQAYQAALRLWEEMQPK